MPGVHQEAAVAAPVAAGEPRQRPRPATRRSSCGAPMVPRQSSCAHRGQHEGDQAEHRERRRAVRRVGEQRAARTSVTATTASGTVRMRRSAEGENRRHASIGPIAVSSTSTSASGVTSRSNQGGPTLASVPVIASEISGKKVPQMITRQSPTSTRLFSRKNASRESSESSRASRAQVGQPAR